MEYLQVVLSYFLLPATGLAIAGYVAQSLLSQLLARDLEKHKNNLARETDSDRHRHARDLEQHKKELEVAQYERQTRFSLMHDRRAKVIAELYGLIFEAEQKISVMTALYRSEPADEELRKQRREQERTEAQQAFNGLQKYFQHNRIFLGAQSAEVCAELIGKMRESFFDFDYSQGMYTRGEQDLMKWADAWKRMKEDVPPIKKKLEADFRTILGITD